MLKQISRHPIWIRIFNWEYWPFHMLYGPIYPIWVYFGLRAGSPFFINTANPNITNGGFLMESKKEIYDQLPKNSYPKTMLFESNTALDKIKEGINEIGLNFPLIAKPDIGMRGMGVKKLYTEQELHNYSTQSSVAYLIQEFVPYHLEVGIFYIRIPGEKKGFISGIVGKEFLTVRGNGNATIRTLLTNDPRHILQIPFLEKDDPQLLNTILAQDQKKLLVPYGNHARGAKFLDYSDQINPELELFIDQLCQQIPDFHFGRIDMRYDNWNSLCKGEQYSIIELNGAGSEPTHIYDPKHSVFFAWREIIKHWYLLFKISKQNHQKLGLPYMNLKDGLKMLRDNTAQIKKLQKDWN